MLLLCNFCKSYATRIECNLAFPKLTRGILVLLRAFLAGFLAILRIHRNTNQVDGRHSPYIVSRSKECYIFYMQLASFDSGIGLTLLAR